MKFVTLKAELAKKEFAPVYIAVGDDDFLVARALEMFLPLVQLGDMNVSYFDQDATMDAMLAAAETLPFMSDYRLIFGLSRHLTFLENYLKNPSSTTIIVLKAEKGYKTSPKVTEIDCNRLPLDVLKSSIASECKKQGCGITQDAAVLLSEYCKRHFGRIRSELTKLIDFKNGETITESDIKAMISPDLEYRVFELSDAIIRKNGDKAMTLLDDMLGEGYGAAVKVFGLIYAHFRRLLSVALDPDAGEFLELKGYALSAAITQSKQFSKVKLKAILDRLHGVDSAIKGGFSQPELALESFVLETVLE